MRHILTARPPALRPWSLTPLPPLPPAVPQPTILRLLLDVVRGLQHLHSKNIVHGDLTPSNILLRVDPAVTASALGLGLVLGPGAGGLAGPGVPEGGAAVETVGMERLLAASGTTTDVGYGELGGHVSHACMYMAKLADFGLSVKMDPSQESVDNDRTGTPFYASGCSGLRWGYGGV